MSYRIQYGPQKGEPVKGRLSGGIVKSIAFTAFAAVIIYILSSPQATAAVRDFLFPGDPAVTKAAFAKFIDSIRGGSSVGQAITAFCREIIEGAAV